MVQETSVVHEREAVGSDTFSHANDGAQRKHGIQVDGAFPSELVRRERRDHDATMRYKCTKK